MRIQKSAVIGLVVASSLFGAPVDRVRGPIDNSRVAALSGNVHPMARPENDRGLVDGSRRVGSISLDLRPTDAQQRELETFLEDQRNPSSPAYHNWLTPVQFADRFGASPNDVAKVVSWLQAEGFTIEHIGSARNWILFGGTAEQIGRTFHTTLRHYMVNGVMHYANDAIPSIPTALAEVVSSIRGLDDFRPHPTLRHAQKAQPQLNRGTYHYLAPDDVAAIYNTAALYKAGVDGTGQKLAIAGQTDIKLLDIEEFRRMFNMPVTDPQVVLVGADPGTSPDDLVEADLDLEWSGAVARNATIVYVNSNNVFTSLQYAIDQNLAPVVSVSYGMCEFGAPASFRTLAQQANAQGITWMNASGDQGAAGCDYGATVASNGPAVIFPADIPEVVAVGGTEFNETGNQGWSATNSATGASALGYIQEEAWNDTTSENSLAASGGGASALFGKPWWQTGTGVPDDNARDVPDVALAASAQHDSYLIVTSDTFMSIGGTSAASPSFAGIVTLLGQYLMSKGILNKPGLGNINPALYALAQNSTGIFHDVTTGSNVVPCVQGSTGCTNGSFGYNAGPGYDLVTGLGSVDAWKLATGWTVSSPGVGVTVKVSANPSSISSSASSQVTATVTPVSGTNPPSGTVMFSLSGTAIGSAALVAGSSSAAATITIQGSALAAGANVVSAAYLPTGNFLSATGSVTINMTTAVATTTTLSANPATIVSTASTTLMATVKATSGTAPPTGAVSFVLGNTTLGSANITGSSAILPVKGSNLAIGNNTITANYTAKGGFANSSSTITVNVTAAPVATTTTVTANPATILSSGSTVVTATIKAPGTATPAGNVTFLFGATVIGTQQVSESTASVTIKGSSLAAGANKITAVYAAAGGFSNSSGAVTLTVTALPLATTTGVTASPASISASAGTVLTATVKPTVSNASPPTGSVTFLLGNATLGTSTVSGSIARLTVQGSSLVMGVNAISAKYTATGNFSNSSGAVSVTVIPPAAATTTAVAANSSTIVFSGNTVVTATVNPVSGNTVPTGSVTFKTGNKVLGSVPVSKSTASLTVKGSSLVIGPNTITASYAGNLSFAASAGTVSVTVTGVRSAASGR